MVEITSYEMTLLISFYNQELMYKLNPSHRIQIEERREYWKKEEKERLKL